MTVSCLGYNVLADHRGVPIPGEGLHEVCNGRGNPACVDPEEDLVRLSFCHCEHPLLTLVITMRPSLVSLLILDPPIGCASGPLMNLCE